MSEEHDIHLHHHFSDRFYELFSHDINQRLDQIMETQTQLAADMATVTAQIAKIGTETSATLQKVADLETALNNAGQTTPEVDAAFAALKTQAQITDDLVPDAPAPTP